MTTAGVPNPREFATIHSWVQAALAATGVTPRQAALAIGISKNAIAELLARPDQVAGRPSLDKLAAYFGVDAAELRAIRPKRPDRIVLGHRQMARLGRERAREIAERGLAAKRVKMAARTPEEWSAITRATGVASRRRNTSADFARIGDRGREVMEKRGYKHTPEGRAAMSERVRRTGQSAAGARAAHPKYGPQHPGVLALRALVQSMEYRDWMRLHGQVTQVLLKVRRSGEENLIERIEDQVAAQCAYLKNPKRRGRPATLLRDRAIAEAAAIMHGE